ncbi:MAG TPA: DUF2938 family protein [Polyangiaceae bacterium]|nr:DUF2938 family protein [Polyangiaceae bacterium]
MNNAVEFLIRGSLIGVGATLTMDLWAALLRRFGIRSLDFRLLGRWLGHIPRGRWWHESIARAAPVSGELWIGSVAHYSIGVSFAFASLTLFGIEWSRSPTLLPSLLLGIATVVAPLFVLQPAFGAGVASSKTSAPLFNAFKSLVTHIVFGVGLFVAAHATVILLPINE